MATFYSPAISSDKLAFKRDGSVASPRETLYSVFVDLRSVFDGTPVALDVIKLIGLPSHAKIEAIKFRSNGALGSPAPTVSIGVWRSELDGGAAVSTTCFGGAVAWGTEAGETNEIAALGGGYLQIWQNAFMSEDPGGELVLGLTLNTNPANTDRSGDAVMGVRIDYTL